MILGIWARACRWGRTAAVPFLKAGRSLPEVKQHAGLAAASVFLLALVACSDSSLSPRPKTWAQPVQLEGVPNLYRVSDELYRSDQPSALGMQNLKYLGIKTIVNLRSFHSDRGKMSGTGFEYEHIYMKAWHPEEEEAVRLLQIVTDRKRAPVLIHCQHGADRTGAMIAVYRIAVEGWSKDEAIREMTEGGFGYTKIWNIPNWIKKLDIDDLKRKAGIKSITEKADKTVNHR